VEAHTIELDDGIGYGTRPLFVGVANHLDYADATHSGGRASTQSPRKHNKPS